MKLQLLPLLSLLGCAVARYSPEMNGLAPADDDAPLKDLVDAKLDAPTSLARPSNGILDVLGLEQQGPLYLLLPQRDTPLRNVDFEVLFDGDTCSESGDSTMEVPRYVCASVCGAGRDFLFRRFTVDQFDGLISGSDEFSYRANPQYRSPRGSVCESSVEFNYEVSIDQLCAELPLLDGNCDPWCDWSIDIFSHQLGKDGVEGNIRECGIDDYCDDFVEANPGLDVECTGSPNDDYSVVGTSGDRQLCGTEHVDGNDAFCYTLLTKVHYHRYTRDSTVTTRAFQSGVSFTTVTTSYWDPNDSFNVMEDCEFKVDGKKCDCHPCDDGMSDATGNYEMGLSCKIGGERVERVCGSAELFSDFLVRLEAALN